MLVEEIMAKNVVDIDCNESVYAACKKYSEFKVGCLVVMDNDINVGIVTERDIIEKIINVGRDPKQTKIREIMTPNIKTVHALAPVEKAAEMMKESKIKKLPVILNNEIVGIITVTDISRAVTVFSEKIEELMKFHNDSKEKVNLIFDEWESILIGLNKYREIIKNDKKELKLI